MRKKKSSGKRKEPGYGVMRHEMAALMNATEERQRKVFEHASVEHLLKFDADFEHWAHANQLPPASEGWRTWLMMAGRGFGKTRAGRSGFSGWRTPDPACGSRWSERRSPMLGAS